MMIDEECFHRQFQPIPNDDHMVAYLMYKDDCVKMQYASKIDELSKQLIRLSGKRDELKEELCRRPLPGKFRLGKRKNARAVAHDTGDGWTLDWEDASGVTDEIPWPFGDHLVTCRDLKNLGFTIV